MTNNLTEIKRVIRRGDSDQLRSAPKNQLFPRENDQLNQKLIKSVKLAIRRNHASVLKLLAYDNFATTKLIVKLALEENKPIIAALTTEQYISHGEYISSITILNMLPDAEKNYLMDNFHTEPPASLSTFVSNLDFIKCLLEEIKYGDTTTSEDCILYGFQPSAEAIKLAIKLGRINITSKLIKHGWIDRLYNQKKISLLEILRAIADSDRLDYMVPILTMVRKTLAWRDVLSILNYHTISAKIIPSMAKIYIRAKPSIEFISQDKFLKEWFLDFITCIVNSGVDIDDQLLNFYRSNGLGLHSNARKFFASLKGRVFSDRMYRLVDQMLDIYARKTFIVVDIVVLCDVNVLEILLKKELKHIQLIQGLNTARELENHFGLLYEVFTKKYSLTTDEINFLFCTSKEPVFDFLSERYDYVVSIQHLEILIKTLSVKLLQKVLHHATCPADLRNLLSRVNCLESGVILLDHLYRWEVSLIDYKLDPLENILSYGFVGSVQELDTWIRLLGAAGCLFSWGDGKRLTLYYPHILEDSCRWLNIVGSHPRLDNRCLLNILHKYDSFVDPIPMCVYTDNRKYWRLWLKKYIVDILIPMAELDLPAYLTYLICCEYYAVCKSIPMYDVWTIITAVKRRWRSINI